MAILAPGAFCLAQIAPSPRWLPERGMHAFDVALTHPPATGHALVEARSLALADDDLRRWIVRELNALAAGSSYGTAYLELLHGFRVPPPPAA